MTDLSAFKDASYMASRGMKREIPRDDGTIKSLFQQTGRVIIILYL